MHPRQALLTGVLLAALLAPGPVPVHGQEQFQLTEGDTWTKVGAPEPGTPEGQIAVARRALAGGQHERAEFLATQWIERHGDHPAIADAHLVRGDALLAQRDYYEALFDFELIARSFPGSDAFVTALERELEIARLFASGTKRKMWGLRIVKAQTEAEELLIRIQERLPGSHLAEQAALTLGDYYFRTRRMELAAEMYGIFIDNFPRSEFVPKARKRLIYAHLASFKGPEFDPTGLYEARANLRSLRVIDRATAEQMGTDALLTRIDESLARKLLVTARWYHRTRDDIAAEITIRRLVRKYPRSVAAAEAMRLIPEILERVPESVQAEAPDYAALRRALLGAGTDARPAEPDAPDDREPAP